MTEQSFKQLLIRMPEELYDAIRKAAFESKRSMTDIANEAIKRWLDWERKNENR